MVRMGRRRCSCSGAASVGSRKVSQAERQLVGHGDDVDAAPISRRTVCAQTADGLREAASCGARSGGPERGGGVEGGVECLWRRGCVRRAREDVRRRCEGLQCLIMPVLGNSITTNQGGDGGDLGVLTDCTASARYRRATLSGEKNVVNTLASSCATACCINERACAKCSIAVPGCSPDDHPRHCHHETQALLLRLAVGRRPRIRACLDPERRLVVSQPRHTEGSSRLALALAQFVITAHSRRHVDSSQLRPQV